MALSVARLWKASVLLSRAAVTATGWGWRGWLDRVLVLILHYCCYRVTATRGVGLVSVERARSRRWGRPVVE